MRPLDDILVLDLSRILSGPFATMQLADFGARIIKVEQPGKGDGTRGYGPPFVEGESAYFLSINRGKESVTLDLKHPRGRAICLDLAAKADVVIENFRPGAAGRLGLGYEEIAARNPRAIYVSISGYGQTGHPEYRTRPGFDLVIQGVSGLQWLTGDPSGSPFKVGTSITDLLAGLFAVQGTLLGLRARARTGRGQHVDVSMLECAISMLTYHAQAHLCGFDVRRSGNDHPNIMPYETFATSDGFLNVACGTDSIFKRFCAAIERPEWAQDPRFASNPSRLAHRDELHQRLQGILATQTRATWCERLEAAGVPCGPIYDVSGALAHPQINSRGYLAQVEHPTCGPLRHAGVTPRLADTPGAVTHPPPTLGAHSDSVLSELLDLDADALKALRADGVI